MNEPMKDVSITLEKEELKLLIRALTGRISYYNNMDIINMEFKECERLRKFFKFLVAGL